MLNFRTKHSIYRFSFTQLPYRLDCSILRRFFNVTYKHEIWVAMVRIQKRLVKKRYYGKAMYQYPVYSFNIPKKFHELLPPFIGEDLQADVKRKSNTLIITLTPKPQKPMEKRFLNKKIANLHSGKPRENSDDHEQI